MPDSKYYKASNPSSWEGRPTEANSGIQYWYQAVQLFNFLEEEIPSNATPIGLLGYACDEGVRRNLGRVGAAAGPNQIKSKLAKLSYHLDFAKIGDFGNIICPDRNLEACQKKLSEVIELLITKKILPIVLGGGHDVAYGHFQGIRSAIGSSPKSRIGIINFDAHFDLRPVKANNNSGTPFFQILKEDAPNVEYFVLGIQRPSNTKTLFEIADTYGVTYIDHQDCQIAHCSKVQDRLKHFIQRNDYLYITIDLDGFSSAIAPGVSAPSPIGFSPDFVFQILQFLMATQKVISCDIAELNPRFDRDDQTANLAARLVEWISRCFNQVD